MSEQEKAEVLAAALRAAGINVDPDTAKVIMGIEKVVDRLGGSISISDIQKVIDDKEG